jgi:hypothetical protein
MNRMADNVKKNAQKTGLDAKTTMHQALYEAKK